MKDPATEAILTIISCVLGAFVLSFIIMFFQNKNAVPSAISAEVHIVTRNNQIQITSSKETINKVSLYSLDAKQLYQVQQLETKMHFIEAASWKTKVLIVQIILETGAVISRKVLW